MPVAPALRMVGTPAPSRMPVSSLTWDTAERSDETACVRRPYQYQLRVDRARDRALA